MEPPGAAAGGPIEPTPPMAPMTFSTNPRSRKQAGSSGSGSQSETTWVIVARTAILSSRQDAS